MKNFSTIKESLVSMAPVIVSAVALLSSACDRTDLPEASLSQASGVTAPVSGLSVESVARMLSELPLTIAQTREVYDGVSASSSNGYDEEYPFSVLVSNPGSGVGDELLRTRSQAEYPEPLRDLLSSSGLSLTRSGSFLEALSDSGLQIYWPYSENWDGETLPTITFDPAEAATVPVSRYRDGENVGYLREQLPEGTWIVKEVVVDEEYASVHPVWVINRNEDAGYLTPQMLKALCPERSAPVSTRSYDGIKTLVLKEFKAHRNYDSWFAGASEFFVKCGSLEGFAAKTEDELKLFSPSVTDMMINVKRKQVGKYVRLNTVLVSEWTPQLDECVFLMVEDDGGKQTSWKASGAVKIKSKSYGFEVELPFRRNDDLVWRGKLSQNYFEKNNGSPNRFGDVSITFSFL